MGVAAGLACFARQAQRFQAISATHLAGFDLEQQLVWQLMR